MRDYDFRGKTMKEHGLLPAGSWIYGGIYIDYCYGARPDGIYQIVNWNSGGPGGFTQQLEIDRKTAGQYTGRMTWDKKRIYEGDVLYFTIFDYDGGDTQHKGVVKWVDELASFILAESMDSNEGYWLYLVLDNDDSAEKIGNIHDNPELLEVQDQ